MEFSMELEGRPRLPIRLGGCMKVGKGYSQQVDPPSASSKPSMQELQLSREELEQLWQFSTWQERLQVWPAKPEEQLH